MPSQTPMFNRILASGTSVLPAGIAGIQIRRIRLENMHGDLGSYIPCWNDELWASRVLELPPAPHL